VDTLPTGVGPEAASVATGAAAPDWVGGGPGAPFPFISFSLWLYTDLRIDRRLVSSIELEPRHHGETDAGSRT
jgi:hypothetical protein